MRHLLSLALALITNAEAISLYNVTVKASPALGNITISILPADKKLQEKYYQSFKGPVAKFKVPAGKYSISVSQADEVNKPKSIEFTSKDITVKSNITVNLPVERIKAVSVNAELAFNRLVLLIGANKAKCLGQTDVSEICAKSDRDFDSISEFMDSHAGMTRISPWNEVTPDTHVAQLKIDKEIYYMTIIEGSSYTLLYMYLQK